MKGGISVNPQIRKNNPDDKIIALAGNPNVGKSTVFNAFTGLKQHTGNWSGKTVTNAQGYFRYKDKGFVLVDIPGCYSLNAHSVEEEAARDFICFCNPDAVVIVCDATCLERNLNLVLQTLEITDNAVLCVNLIDEAEKKGIEINFSLLSEILGIPVIPAAARSEYGLDSLMSEIYELFEKKSSHSAFKMIYDDKTEHALSIVQPAAEKFCKNQLCSRWLAMKLLENDVSLISSINVFSGHNISQNPEIIQKINEAYDYLESVNISVQQFRDNVVSDIVHTAEDIFNKTVSYDSDRYSARDRKIDKFLTGRKTGFITMFFALMLVFWITIQGANYPSAVIQSFLFGIEEPFFNMLASVNIPLWICNMTVYGVYRVLAWIVSVMLPPMAIFFPLFAILEDSGYLPRVAFNLDKCFKKCCTCGKQCLTMCMGFGCNASGVVGCRIIDSPRERLIAMITNSFVPCNGRFPMIISLITMYFAGTAAGFGSSVISAFILTLVILLGIGMTFISSKLLSETVLKGVPSSFTLELPPYRKPQILKVIVRSVCDRVVFVLARAVISAIPAGLIIWIMANISVGDTNILLLCADFLEPFAHFIGLDGVILMAFILGMPANEIVVPIIIMAYTATGNLTEISDINELKMLFEANGWNCVTAVCTILFSLFHWPCTTTLLTIKKESGSLKWTFAAFALPAVTGIVLCGLTANIMRIFI